MKRKVKINTIDDLRNERNRLKALTKAQEGYLSDQYSLLGKKVAAPVRIFNMVASNIPGVGVIQDLLSAKSSKHTGIGAKIVHVIAPLIANRFLPKKSGLMVRGIFSFLAKQTAVLATSGKLSEFLSNATSLIKKSKKHPEHTYVNESGIDDYPTSGHQQNQF